MTTKSTTTTVTTTTTVKTMTTTSVSDNGDNDINVDDKENNDDNKGDSKSRHGQSHTSRTWYGGFSTTPVKSMFASVAREPRGPLNTTSALVVYCAGWNDACCRVRYGIVDRYTGPVVNLFTTHSQPQQRHI